ncbi:hypothetical protein FFK22_041220 [Mycobacterium sp. KBS0706]|nr:hypothetical protein FFK22_041220 [Mycobacterium sp. KBS0706]
MIRSLLRSIFRRIRRTCLPRTKGRTSRGSRPRKLNPVSRRAPPSSPTRRSARNWPRKARRGSKPARPTTTCPKRI